MSKNKTFTDAQVERTAKAMSREYHEAAGWSQRPWSDLWKDEKAGYRALARWHLSEMDCHRGKIDVDDRDIMERAASC